MNTNLIESVKKLSAEHSAQIIDIRRKIHQNPELGFEEEETSALVQQTLSAAGIEFEPNFPKTGIVGTIKGNNPGSEKVVALRADMDALPIHETNNVPYKSKKPGVMHACGHDVHTSSLLGSATVLKQLQNEFSGTIKLIFQPSEERLPSGAHEMLKAGLFEKHKPDVIFGQHVHPPLATGKLGFRGGQYMASADEIHMTVKGKGGHAGTPHLTTDPVVISAQIIIALQQLISRRRDPFQPAVLSFGRVIAEGATNIIPDKVSLQGTLRAMNEEWRWETHKRIKELAEGVARGMGAECDVDVRPGLPSLFNNEALTQQAWDFGKEYIGEDFAVETQVRMTAEDFAWFSHEVPACFYRLGVSNEAKGITSPVHTPTFNIDEDALELGMGFMAYLAIRSLQ